MSKKQDDEITFSKLAQINLEIPGHLDTIQPDEPEDKPERATGKDIDTIKTSFKIERNVHRSLKQYCLIHEIEMADFVFDQIIKSFLVKQGYYPPRQVATKSQP